MHVDCMSLDRSSLAPQHFQLTSHPRPVLNRPSLRNCTAWPGMHTVQIAISNISAVPNQKHQYALNMPCSYNASTPTQGGDRVSDAHSPPRQACPGAAFPHCPSKSVPSRPAPKHHLPNTALPPPRTRLPPASICRSAHTLVKCQHSESGWGQSVRLALAAPSRDCPP
jgi:hypothetical protein